MKFTSSIARSSLFAALTVFSSVAAKAACDHPVDPSRATIYIGLNQSILENAAAEEAACLRGETFIQIPKPVEGVEAAELAMGTKVRAESAIKNLEDERNIKCAGDNASATDCTDLRNRISSAWQEKNQAETIFNEYWNRLSRTVGGMAMLDVYTDTLRELAAKNVRIKTLIFSGHSGGNGVWGSLGVGGIPFEAVQNRINTVFADKMNLLSELNTVLLWGCNTINPYNSPASWVKFHPGLNLIFGFQGSAPSAKNPASPMLLKSVMMSEKEVSRVLKLANPEAEIQKLFDGLKGIGHTIGSAFINAPGKEKGWYYERTFKRDYSVTPNVDTWVSKVSGTVMCESIRDQLDADQTLARRYMDGELAIPADTSSGALRELYTTARRNEECRKRLGLKISADQVGYLLFWNDVKKNAARLMSSHFVSQLEDLSELNVVSEIQKAIDQNLKDTEYARTQNLKFMQQSINEKKISLDSVLHRIEALQEISANYKWTDRDERRFKKLKEKLDALASKPKKAKKYERLAKEWNALKSIKEVTQATDPANALKYLLLAAENDKNWYSRDIARIEDNIKQLPSSSNSALKASEISQIVTSVINGFPRLDVAAVTPMTVTDLRRQLGAALELVSSAKTAMKKSGLWTLDSQLSRLETMIESYNKIALELRTECLDFPTWHEYLENPVEAPRTNCRY